MHFKSTGFTHFSRIRKICNFQILILLKFLISKNTSEKNMKTFHQIWSWLWKLLTKTPEENISFPAYVKQWYEVVISQRSCLNSLSLRMSPKKRTELLIRSNLDHENSSQEQAWKELLYYTKSVWSIIIFCWRMGNY